MSRLLQRLGIIVCMGAVAAVFGDLITLDSGKTIEGTIVAESELALQVRVGGATVTVPRSKIVSISKTSAATTPATATISIERLQGLELKGDWPALYEAATAILAVETSHPIALDKQKAAALKIRESLGMAQITELVRGRKFDDAITTLTERIRLSGLSSRPAGAVGRRALAELYLGRAEYRLRQSGEAHGPLADARKARELDPTTPGVDYLEGMAQMRLRNLDLAAGLLERALRAEPHNFGVLMQLMQCYRAKGDHGRVAMLYEAAPKDADAAAERWPEVREALADAFLQIAARLARESKRAEAGAVYEKYLKFADPTPSVLRDAAAFYEQIGDRERARALRTQKTVAPTAGNRPPASGRQ
ncbi:MAG: hypothetical protein N3D11_00690 [Candidatus Sumerlaeia bacterium]|nr:hypothetical protein [Candidatus Sumerlaeia bacterium]